MEERIARHRQEGRQRNGAPLSTEQLRERGRLQRRFPAEYRYSGSALSTNLSWIFGAAFAPLCGMFLAAYVGLWASALYLLSGALVTYITLRILDRQLSDDAG